METTTRTYHCAHAAGTDWQTMTRDCLAQLGDPAAGARLGFLYVTDALDGDLEQICTMLRDATGITEWVGTVGMGVCAAGAEYFDTPAMVILVAAMDDDSFRILPTLTQPGEPLPDDLPDWVARRHPTLGVVHGDPRNAYLPSIILSIIDDTECFLVGGLTASRGEFHQIAGGLTDGGVSGILFADDVAVVTGLTQGCSPIGPVREVTDARDNMLLALDGRPALDVFKEDIGEVLARNLSRAGGYIHAALPVADSDQGDYLVRNVVGVDPESGWMSIGERLSRGDKMMFVRRDAPNAMTDLKRMLDDVSGRAATTPKAALYFSCLARGPNLFGRNSEELRAVTDVIGDVPLVGFFANGEICNNRVYGYTGVLTLFL